MHYNNCTGNTAAEKAKLFSEFFSNSFNQNSYDVPEFRSFVNDNLCFLMLIIMKYTKYCVD